MKEQVKKLHQQGYSIREIAEKVNTSKSTVARWLQETSSNQPFPSKPNPNIELELKRMQLNHELELRKLAQQERELDIRHKQSKDQDRFNGIELRKRLLPIQKWASLQLKLMNRNLDGAVPCNYQDITNMKSQLSQYEVSLSDYVRIHQLDEWDDCLDILSALLNKTEEWLGQLDEIRDKTIPFDPNSDDNQDCSYSWKAFETDLMYLEEILG
jgi:transcriptional regulator with XRE-family HTH domain